MENIDRPEQEKNRLDTHGAHSRFRTGQTDYGDGGHLTHYLGNDEYVGNEETDHLSENEEALTGKEAQGNELHDVEEHDLSDEAGQSPSGKTAPARPDFIDDGRH